MALRGVAADLRNWQPPLYLIGGAAFALLLLSLPRAAGTAYQVNLAAGLAGIKTVLPTTGWAALRVWAFVSVAIVIVAGLLLRLEPELGWFDGLIAGAGLLWTGAYLLGQALGPIGLFRAPTIWALLLIGAGLLWRYPPARVGAIAGATERRLALLAALIIAIVILPLQLGSPVVPYYDVLSYPASAQRIISFGKYLPFDNDPFGCWGPQAQTPGLELLYALIGMGSNTPLALLAESAMIVPIAALIVCATYKLGATLISDEAGAMASLLLPLTIIFRRSVGMRGTAVDLALAALALGFLLDQRASRVRITLGGLFLGAAIASHSIDGGLATMVAAITIAAFLPSGQFRCFLNGVIILLGVVAIAAPDVAITLARPLPYPVLPLIQIGGGGLVVIGARSLAAQPLRWLALPQWSNRGLVLLFLAMVAWRVVEQRYSVMETVARNFPITTGAALIGTFALAIFASKVPAHLGGFAIMPLFVGLGLEIATGSLWRVAANPSFQAAVSDIVPKLQEYWIPYFLVFPAAVPFALTYRRSSHALTILFVLALVIYPWNQRLNASYDYVEHSLTEELGITLGTGSGGYWFSSGDSRWALDRDGFALVDFLRGEQALGRITTATHVLHLANDVKVNGDFDRFAVYTGIDDDPIVNEIPATDLGWLAGGRVRRMEQLPVALAKMPPYILEQIPPPAGLADPPAGYSLVFHSGGLRLLRRDTQMP